MTSYVKNTRFMTEAQDTDALLDILKHAAEMMKDTGGCTLYHPGKASDDNTTIIVMEVWESKEAHDRALTQPEVIELITKAKPLIKGTAIGLA